jgi:hypothetical protein
MASSNYPQSPSFFGRPAPILGSDLAPYDTLSSRVSAALSPTDAFEEMWVADIVDLSLDVFQQRRVKAGPIASNHRRSLPGALVLHGKEPGGETLSKRYVAPDPAAINKVDAILGSAAPSADAVMTRSRLVDLDRPGRIERMIAGAEARRHKDLL